MNKIKKLTIELYSNYYDGENKKLTINEFIDNIDTWICFIEETLKNNIKPALNTLNGLDICFRLAFTNDNSCTEKEFVDLDLMLNGKENDLIIVLDNMNDDSIDTYVNKYCHNIVNILQQLHDNSTSIYSIEKPSHFVKSCQFIKRK